MNPLQLTGERQAVWSATANRLKARYSGTRSIAFALSITGAFLAVLASQRPEGQVRLYLAILSAVLFALVSFLTARVLGAQRAMDWLRARVASEALKREAFRHAATAAPYDDLATKDSRLNSERERIEEDVDDLIGYCVPSGLGSTPTETITPDEYIERRIERQINQFLEPKAAHNQRIAVSLRRAEFGLALITTCITAIVGVAGKDPAGWGFDFVALTAVLTTVSGAILAHIEAGRYEFTATNYRATARRLKNALVQRPANFTAPSAEWSAFVNSCEAILTEENNTWMAKWSKP